MFMGFFVSILRIFLGPRCLLNTSSPSGQCTPKAPRRAHPKTILNPRGSGTGL